jgi:adenylate kinase family enzyme
VRLHVIGIPSAGKTTLATGVSARLGVPHHDLDPLTFIDDRWTLRSERDRDAMLARILEEPSFVTEGGFLGWTEDLFAAADHIVWLDPPLSLLMWRHVRRHWAHPRSLPSLLLFQVRSYRRPVGAGPAKDDPNQVRAGIERALRPWADKVYRVTRSVSVDDVIDRLGLSR